MFVEDLDVDVALDLRPIGDLEHHVLIIVENCAANRHDASTPFANPEVVLEHSRRVGKGAQPKPVKDGRERPIGPTRLRRGQYSVGFAALSPPYESGVVLSGFVQGR